MKKKVLAIIIAVVLLTAMCPLAFAGNIDSITIAVPKVDNIQITMTNVLDKYFEGDIGYGYGYTFYLDAGGTVTFPYDMALTNFAAGTTVNVTANVPVSIDEIAGAGYYAADFSAYFTIDTNTSPYFSADLLTFDLNALAADGSEPASAPAPAPAPAGGGAQGEYSETGVTVYFTVSLNGRLEIAAQPVLVHELTVDGAIKAAHEQYFPGGASGYSAGIDATYFMYMINTIWGIPTTPYVVLNGTPLGADPTLPTTADTAPVKEGDNIIVNIAEQGAAIPVVALKLDGEGRIVATTWALDFTTFQYNSTALGSTDIIDAASGKKIGTTDGTGKLKVDAPESGVAAVMGLAAIPLRSDIEKFTAYDGKYEPPAYDYGVFGGMENDGKMLLVLLICGLALAVPTGIAVLYGQNKELKTRGMKIDQSSIKLNKR